MMIVRNEVTETLDAIGAVSFEPLDRAADYYRKQYGRTHQQRFRFTVAGREYWGEVIRSYDRNGKPGSRTSVDVELMTKGTHHSRTIQEGHKAAWRVALRSAFKSHLEAFLTDQEGSGPAVAAVIADEGHESPITGHARADDSDALRAALRADIRAMRDKLATLATQLETVDHDAARDVNEARSSLFAAWSKIRVPAPRDDVESVA